MRLEFDIYEFLRRDLPQHKRQTNRLALFYWPLAEIASLWDSFREWRKEMIYESNITGQRMSLVGLLNRLVSNSGNGITIIEHIGGGIWLSKEEEFSDMAEISLISENSDYKYIARKGEETTAIDGDFLVLVPDEVNVDEVRKIVDRYCIAGFEYTVTKTI